MHNIIDNLKEFWQFTGFANFEWGYLIMIVIGCLFIFLAIKYEWEPMLLVPIGFGILIGNIPLFAGLNVGVYEEGSVLNILYQGVQRGFYPPLIFLGIGAMTDFSALIANPKLLLIGAAFIAIGVLISALTENQIAAAVMSFVVLMLLFMLDTIANLVNIEWIATLLGYLSFSRKYYAITYGLFNVSTVVFYISVAVIFNYLTIRVFERRRWS